MPTARDTSDPPRLLERVLGLVTEVRPRELAGVLLVSLNAFVLLAAYSCIKPVREAWIIALPSGAEFKIYMAGCTAVVLVGLVPAYAKLASLWPRNRLVVATSVFFALHLLAFYFWGRSSDGSFGLALGFYVWIGVFNMMSVAQLWGFANDLYSEEEGKRLFPLVGLGMSLGAVAGAGFSKVLIGPLGMMPLLLVGAGMLLGSAWLFEWSHRAEAHRIPTSLVRQIHATQPPAANAINAFRMVFQRRYLTLIGLFSLLFTLVKTNGDYVLARLVKDAAHSIVQGGAAHASEAYIGEFYASYFFYIDVVGLLMQALVVSRVVKYLGVGFAFLILPVMVLGDSLVTSVVPLLAVVHVTRVAESGTDYSLNNTVRNMLWLTTARAEKYVAKQAVDTFFVRLGDVVSGLAVLVGGQLLGGGVRAFALGNAGCALVWLWLTKQILSEQARLRTLQSPSDSGDSISQGGNAPVAQGCIGESRRRAVRTERNESD